MGHHYPIANGCIDHLVYRLRIDHSLELSFDDVSLEMGTCSCDGEYDCHEGSRDQATQVLLGTN